MELIELVSLQVAMPVIGVVICAIMVFTFGFRSPVQPPSFSFEEDESKRMKRRPKTAKVKAPTNGNVVQSEVAPVETTKASLQLNKEKKLTSPPQKTKSIETKTASFKKDNKQESKSDKKVKKPTGKDVKADPIADLEKKEAQDDGEWTTIQVSKKGKKQKISMKDESQAEAATAPADSDSSPAPHAAAAAAAPQAPEIEEPKSPQTDKGKKKKKNKTDETIVAQNVERSAMESNNNLQQPEVEGKKKKSKREKKSTGQASEADGAAASASESFPQDATPASGKTRKEISSVVTPGIVENTADVTWQTPKKKKGKGKDNVESQQKSIEKVEPSKSDRAVKQEISEPTKSEKMVPNVKDANVESILSTNSDKIPSPSGSGAGNAPPSGISFDEIGDSWIEAAPKSKKKKPRRDN